MLPILEFSFHVAKFLMTNNIELLHIGLIATMNATIVSRALDSRDLIPNTQVLQVSSPVQRW